MAKEKIVFIFKQTVKDDRNKGHVVLQGVYVPE